MSFFSQYYPLTKSGSLVLSVFTIDNKILLWWIALFKMPLCHYKNKKIKFQNYTYVLSDTFILVSFQLIYNTVLFISVGAEPSPQRIWWASQ